jgi:hypothetical protein
MDVLRDLKSGGVYFNNQKMATPYLNGMKHNIYIAGKKVF